MYTYSAERKRWLRKTRGRGLWINTEQRLQATPSDWPQDTRLPRKHFRTESALGTHTHTPRTILSSLPIFNGQQPAHEWSTNAPLSHATPPGITQEHFQSILTLPLCDAITTSTTIFDEPHSVVIVYADAMTLDVSVSYAVFDRLKKRFSAKQVVEITATVAAYN